MPAIILGASVPPLSNLSLPVKITIFLLSAIVLLFTGLLNAQLQEESSENFEGGIRCWLPGHLYSDPQYIAEDSCEHNLICMRCGYEKQGKVSHYFEKWEYIAADNCKQERVCKRCRYKEQRTVEHQLSEWQYIAADNCKQERVCNRGDFRKTRDNVHQFGEWRHLAEDNCTQVRICGRCDREEMQTHHSFGIWEYISDHNCAQVRICKRCDCKEHREDHDSERISESITGGIQGQNGDTLFYEGIATMKCNRCHKVYTVKSSVAV